MFTVTPVFPTLHMETEYELNYRTNAWESEHLLIGTLSRIRVAPLNGDSNSSAGIPMLGFKPRKGPEQLVEVPWESITRIGLAVPWRDEVAK